MYRHTEMFGFIIRVMDLSKFTCTRNGARKNIFLFFWGGGSTIVYHPLARSLAGVGFDMEAIAWARENRFSIYWHQSSAFIACIFFSPNKLTTEWNVWPSEKIESAISRIKTKAWQERPSAAQTILSFIENISDAVQEVKVFNCKFLHYFAQEQLT